MKLTEEIFINGSSPSSSSRPIHVYLSFRGDEETCRFTDMLWAALETDDLNTFWDDKKLESSRDSIFLPRHFLKAIQQSNISIVVFSKSYASSIWCLEELSEIFARIHELRYSVFPIFYDVDQLEVQNLGNSFQKYFASHERKFTANSRKVQSWKLAMKRVADLSGWHVTHESGPQVIDDIIIKVKKKMRELVYIDVDLVGMKSRVNEVEKLLDLGSNGGVRVVGICGMGGIGKTTIARVLYDRISHHFEASHFLLSIYEIYKIKVKGNVKNILVVVDGIDHRLVLKPMIRIVKSNWLGGGSRIIITTRDEGVLKMFEKYDIYRVKLLTKEEALQLFCRKAFKCDCPMRGYEEQIDSVLQYASGLPLAIVVLSQFFYNRRASEWSSTLVESKKIANSMIMNVLKKSFDELDLNCKEIFLDVACFFTGKEIKFVEGVLNSTHTLSSVMNHPVKYHMQLLVEKSLMTIINQKVQMHGLLQEMGREIVRHEFPSKPDEWTRLWDFNDIRCVMQNDTAPLKVEAIVLELEDSQKSMLRVEGLSCMSSLRLLIFHNVKFFGALKHLSSHLRYLSWHQYPFTSLPSSFVPYCLKELILPDSNITTLWDVEKASPCSDEEENVAYCLYQQSFPCLRNLNLRGSKDLTKMPNFIVFICLERLDLEGCTKLSQLGSSITNLSRLQFLNLRNCTNLISIPNQLFSRSSLEILNLARCFKLAYCLNFSPFEELSDRKTI